MYGCTATGPAFRTLSPDMFWKYLPPLLIQTGGFERDILSEHRSRPGAPKMPTVQQLQMHSMKTTQSHGSACSMSSISARSAPYPSRSHSNIGSETPLSSLPSNHTSSQAPSRCSSRSPSEVGSRAPSRAGSTTSSQMDNLDQDEGPPRRAPRNSKKAPDAEPQPTRLTYYTDDQRKVIADSKELLVLQLCLKNAFPTPSELWEMAGDAFTQAKVKNDIGMFHVNLVTPL